MNNYLIPANSKRSQLIFNIFRPIDLVIFATGAVFTLILMFVFKGDSVQELVFKLAPVMITGLLVVPIAHYHNGMVFLREMYIFYTKQNKYLWRGWCAWYVGSEDETKG